MRSIFLILAVLALSACGEPEVETLDVKIPSGVQVPEGMVYIPEGEFIMGHPDEPRTRGGVKVSTPAYFIDRYEVSRGAYAQFDPKRSVAESKADFPVVFVNHAEAQAYCASKGGRLPTEEEWEKAARGVDSRKWPWGRFFEHPNNGFSGFLSEPVAKRPEWISPYGLYGMGHNVWEWTADWYGYPGQPRADRETFRVIRGGLTQTHVTIKFSPTWFRNWMHPENAFQFLGFRCAKDVR
ncbi:MAG: formylglycine-generating enzyme family protein [Candidatus Nitrohelix vancouverensis]|uniref:Formylglycine-generating enzyme family protein n=1 Tax=Candidatus Nitrohelix vancouverensis TaxID=2705534 RepID=A0A7T0G2D2_9BACT|nr:MAG: formylglycine-generating enzyme family protein [Candidatus Nitrohelix vancouverensis]